MHRQKKESRRREQIMISSSEEYDEDSSSDQQNDIDERRFKILNQSKVKFLKEVKIYGVKNINDPKEKMEYLVKIAEQMINFLLTRKSGNE